MTPEGDPLEPERPERAGVGFERALRLRGELAGGLAAFAGRERMEGDAELVYEYLDAKLPKACDRDALRRTVEAAASRRWSPDDLLLFCHRLAANLDRLRLGHPVYPWAGRSGPAWTLFRFTRAAPAKLGRNTGTAYQARALSGEAAGLVASAFWNDRQPFLLSWLFGFDAKRTRATPRARSVYPYAAPAQYVGMYFFGLVTVETCQRGLGFGRVHVTPDLKARNRRLLRARYRIDEGTGCPKGYGPDHPCHRCPVGYASLDGCGVAVHALTYVRRPCPGCDRPDAWFDPEAKTGLCVACDRKKALGR